MRGQSPVQVRQNSARSGLAALEPRLAKARQIKPDMMQ